MHPGGMGPSVPGRIPWTVVRDWCAEEGYTRGEFAELDTCFAAMDDEYLAHWQEHLPPSMRAPPP